MKVAKIYCNARQLLPVVSIATLAEIVNVVCLTESACLLTSCKSLYLDIHWLINNGRKQYIKLHIINRTLMGNHVIQSRTLKQKAAFFRADLLIGMIDW